MSDFGFRPAKPAATRKKLSRPAVTQSRPSAGARAKPIAYNVSSAGRARQTLKRPKKKSRSAYWQLALMLIGLGLVVGTEQVLTQGNGPAVSETKGAAVAREEPEPPPPPPPVDTTDMARKINEVIAANPSLQIGVSFVDLNAGRMQQFGVGEPYIAASTAKLLSAAMFLHKVEDGSARLEDPINGRPASEQLRLLIAESDNTVWVALNDQLGRDNLLAYARRHGLQNYDSATNTLTVGDVAIFLQKLYKRELLNEQHTSLILSHMQHANQNDYIVASLPAGTGVYHKAGWLKDRLHDAAIIVNDKHPYVLVIFTKSRGDYDPAVGRKVFSQITTATVETMFQP